MVPALPDHHIHSSYSRCNHETYDLLDIVRQLRTKEVPYYCVSDHIHWDDDDQYFPHHLEAAQKLMKTGLERPLFLGAEITIIDRNGNLPRQEQSAGKLSYFMAGDHYIPGTSITMDDLLGSKRILLELVQHQPNELREILGAVKQMYIGCVRNHKPRVLVHPYSTFLRCKFTHATLIEDWDAVCQACQETQTAIELNLSQIEMCLLHPAPPLCDHPDVPPLPEFYRALLRTVAKYDLLYSLGSDAHTLLDVGNVTQPWAIAQEFHLSPKKILNFVDHPINIRPFE